MADKYLQMMFGDVNRMKEAIEDGVEKKMRWAVLNEMCDPEYRAQWCLDIYNGAYDIKEPYIMGVDKPHTYDPETKKPEQRYVVVCSNKDRTFLTMTNNITFELCGSQLVHPACKSYQKGMGCGNVVKQAVREMKRTMDITHSNKIGVKLDLSKYFDSVPRWKIHETLDKVEAITGPSAVLKVVRKLYDDDRLLIKSNETDPSKERAINVLLNEKWGDKVLSRDEKGFHVQKYQSLKQGVATASFLADACLYEMDEGVCKFDVYYVRYSDDMLIIGPEWMKALKYVEEFLKTLDMKLNPKKIEVLDYRKWFRFLGFNLRGGDVTLSYDTFEMFKKRVQEATIKKVLKRGVGKKLPIKDVLRSLYKAMYGSSATKYSLAGYLFPVVTNKHDLIEMNRYMIDCARAAANGFTRVSGFGCDMKGKEGCLKREDDKWHAINGRAIGELPNYNTIENMRMLMLRDTGAYRMELREMYRQTLSPALSR